MATFPKAAVVPTGIKERNKFDLSNDNITTSDFFKLKPSRVIECIPEDSYSVSSESLIRVYPLAVPTFGRVNHFMRWFWVPFRTLMKGWNEFIEQTPYVLTGELLPALVGKVPTFNNIDIINLIADSVTDSPLNGYYATAVADNVVADGTVRTYSPESALVRFRFTKAGRALMDILHNCGYQITMSRQDDREFSALPFLAYLRVYADYYLSPQYINMFQALFNVTNDNIFRAVSYLSEWLHDYLPGFACYDQDLFVSAWDNPISPNDVSANPTINVNDITLTYDQYKSNVTMISPDKTPLVRGLTNTVQESPIRLTDYIIKSLRQVTNYCVRNNIAGYKFWDRLQAEYGAVLDYKEKGTSLYIDTITTKVKIAEVISTSDTQGAELGSLGGQALGYSDENGFNFKTDEPGFLVAVSSIIPVISYYQGVDRMCLHKTPLDFFHPDFESLGVAAIQGQELFGSQFVCDSADGMVQGNELLKVFGFAPRYYEYKVANNTLSGDFRLYSRASQGSINSYHVMREIGNEFDFNVDNNWSVQHDLNFVQGNNSQYDRIFANTSDEFDHFILIHHHEVHAERNMKSLSETIFDNEDLEHNKKTTVTYNGSQLN